MLLKSINLKNEVIFKMRKAQAAMEFLMTYGWAILVVLAAIGALAYFGIFNFSLPTKCELTGFGCSDVVATSTGTTVDVYMTNTLGYDIGVDAGDLTISTGTGDCTWPAADQTWSNGADETLSFDNTDGCIAGTEQAGAVFKADIEVIYENLNNGATHTKTGFLSTRWE